MPEHRQKFMCTGSEMWTTCHKLSPHVLTRDCRQTSRSEISVLQVSIRSHDNCLSSIVCVTCFGRGMERKDLWCCLALPRKHSFITPWVHTHGLLSLCTCEFPNKIVDKHSALLCKILIILLMDIKTEQILVFTLTWSTEGLQMV